MVLLAAYALPLLLPPAATPLLPSGPHATLMDRLFPGVPAWWLIARLCCLTGGAWLVALGLPPNPRLFRLPRRPLPHPRAWQLWASLFVAFVLLWMGVLAARLDRPGQLLFVALTPLPAILLLQPRFRSVRLRSVASTVSLPLLWAVCWLPLTWRSSWMANLVDTLGPFTVLERTASDPQFNLLTSEFRRGITGFILIAQGAGFFNLFGWTPSFDSVQIANALGMLCAGVMMAALVGRLLGRHAASVAAAALLFSPYCMVAPIFLAPMFLGFLVPALLLLLLLGVHGRRSAAALAGLAAVSGIPATNPTVSLIAWAAFALAMLSAQRAPRLPMPARLTAILVFSAVLLPGIPAALQMGELVEAYTVGRSQWATIESMYFGQIDPELVKFAETSGQFPRLDALAGSLLSPFAIPRTAMRVWGDTLTEPLSATLAAIGIAVCIRARSKGAAALLGFLLLALLPGVVTSYDRTSLTRMAALPVPMALLTAVGFHQLCAAHFRRAATLRAAVFFTVVIALSGWVMARVVQPAHLARSATGIIIETVANDHPSQALILHPYWSDPQATAVFASRVAVPAIATQRFEGAAGLRRSDGDPLAEHLFWSPSLEEQGNVAEGICSLWPKARLFTVFDAAGLSRAFAASPRDLAWQPKLAPQRWVSSDCHTPLETQSSHARAELRQARHRLARKRPREAIAILRAAATRSIVQVPLFDTLARALLLHPATAADRQEALFWAERAVRVCNACVPRAVATLASAYKALGRNDEARQARAIALQMQRTTCRGLRDGHPWKPHDT